MPEHEAKSGFHNGKGMGSVSCVRSVLPVKKIAGGRNIEMGVRALLSVNAREGKVACDSWTAIAALRLQVLAGGFGELWKESYYLMLVSGTPDKESPLC